jgi:uncharacterized repeat protein (TIGR01451 family)
MKREAKVELKSFHLPVILSLMLIMGMIAGTAYGQDLAIGKVAGPGPNPIPSYYYENDQFTYTITVVSTGTNNNVTITDVLPLEVDFVSSNPPVDGNPTVSYDAVAGRYTVTWNAGTVVDTQVTLDITVQIVTSPEGCIQICNQASVDSDESDPAVSNLECIDYRPSADLEVHKDIVFCDTAYHDPNLTPPDTGQWVGPFIEGQQLVFEVSVVNNGPTMPTTYRSTTCCQARIFRRPRVWSM